MSAEALLRAGPELHFGVDFGGTNVKFGLFNAVTGRVVDFHQVPLISFMAASASSTAADVKRELPLLLLHHAKEFLHGRQPVQGGLSIKGLVADGTVLNDIGAGEYLAGVDLRGFFSRGLGIQSFQVENDARCYAFGEYVFGAGREFASVHNGRMPRVMVCLTLGTGVGCGVVVDGSLYYGANHLGGILGGHISIDARCRKRLGKGGEIGEAQRCFAERCPCGAAGCLELYCSATALEQRVRKRHPELLASAPSTSSSVLRYFFASASQKNCSQRLRETLEVFLDDLSAGIINVVHAYGPDLVVVGGGLSLSAAAFLPQVSARVRSAAWTYPRGDVTIVAARHSSAGAALGAAFLPAFPRGSSKL